MEDHSKDFAEIGQVDKLRDPAVRIGVGCAIALLFLLVFLCVLLVLPEVVPEDTLAYVPWILLLALIAVLPFLVEYLRPMVTAVKLGSMLEFTFRDVKARDAGLHDLEETLDQLDYVRMSAQEYAGTMTSFSSQIIDKVKEVIEQRAEVLWVDLGSGNRWVVSNLYFLALLTASRTNVQQLVFTDAREQEEKHFLGMCAPADLIGRVGVRLPGLVQAQSKADYRYGALDYGLGAEFFQGLNEVLAADAQADEYKRWVTQGWLDATLGTALHVGQITWREGLDLAEYRLIMMYPHRYLAAVRAGQYLFAIDRCQVSIQIARSALRVSESRR